MVSENDWGRTGVERGCWADYRGPGHGAGVGVAFGGHVAGSGSGSGSAGSVVARDNRAVTAGVDERAVERGENERYCPESIHRPQLLGRASGRGLECGCSAPRRGSPRRCCWLAGSRSSTGAGRRM